MNLKGALRPENPILRYELRHQTRTGPRWLRFEGLFAAALLPALLAPPVVAMLHMAKGHLAFFDYSGVIISGQIALWALLFAASGRFIVAGAMATGREHALDTWETLVLTNYGPARVYFAKWRAALRRTAPWMLVLGLYRLLLLPIWTAALAFPYYANEIGQARACSVSNCPPGAIAALALLPKMPILAPALVVALTIAEAMACTLLGVAMGALFRRSGAGAVGAAVLRFAPALLVAGVAFRPRAGMAFYAWFSQWWNFSAFTLFDGGMSGVLRIVTPLESWRMLRVQSGQTVALAGLLMLVALSGLAFAILILSIKVQAHLPGEWFSDPSRPKRRDAST